MVVQFCPRCGSIMVIKVVEGQKIYQCKVCGYTMNFTGKSILRGLVPLDLVENRVGKGIVHDKKRRIINISEDERKEILDLMAGEAEE